MKTFNHHLTFTPNIQIDFTEGYFLARRHALRIAASFAGRNPKFPEQNNVMLECSKEGKLTWWATNSLSTIMLGHGQVSYHAMADTDRINLANFMDVAPEIYFAKSTFPAVARETRDCSSRVARMVLVEDDNGKIPAYPDVTLLDTNLEFLPPKPLSLPFDTEAFHDQVDQSIDNGFHVSLSKEDISSLVRMIRAAKALEQDKTCRYVTEFHLERKDAAPRTKTILKVWSTRQRKGSSVRNHIFLGELEVVSPDGQNAINLWRQFVTKRLYFLMDTILRLQPSQYVGLHFTKPDSGLPMVAEFHLQSDVNSYVLITFDTQNPLSYVKTNCQSH